MKWVLVYLDFNGVKGKKLLDLVLVIFAMRNSKSITLGDKIIAEEF
jgi:hypothetical protein